VNWPCPRSTGCSRGGALRWRRPHSAAHCASGKTAAAGSPTRIRQTSFQGSSLPPRIRPSHGWWLSAARHWATLLFGSLSGELAPATIDGGPGWIVAGDTLKAARHPSCVRLLPYFDAYVVGCQPRDRLFAGEATHGGLSRGQAGNFPVVLIDGVVGGLWRQRRSGHRAEITAELFRPLTMPQKDELRAQAERIGDFVGAGPIRARAHA
jgi:hypothetical protein